MGGNKGSFRARGWVVSFALISCISYGRLARAQCAGVTDCTAISGNAADVQQALGSINMPGTTLRIPAGTWTWATTVGYTSSGDVTILGAGSQSTTGGGDRTIILDRIVRAVDGAG